MADIEKEKEAKDALDADKTGDKKTDASQDRPSQLSVRDLVMSASAAFGDLTSEATEEAPLENAPQESAEASGETSGEPATEEVEAAPAPEAKSKKSRGGKKGEQKPKKESKKKSSKKADVAWSAEAEGLEFVEEANEPAPEFAQELAPEPDVEAGTEAQAQSAAGEDDALSRFEELARRVAATVSRNEDEETPEEVEAAAMDQAEGESEQPREIETSPAEEMDEAMLASQAILADMGEVAEEVEEARSEGEFVAAAATETEGAEGETIEMRDDLSPEAEAVVHAHEHEASGEMDQMGFSALEEELDAAENDADPEPTEFIEQDQLVSIIESLLFSTDKPVSVATIKQIFKGSNVRTKDITRALDMLASEYASASRGVTLEEINGGYQLRTKVDNAEFLRRLAKTRPFRLSGPALEVMAIVAYKQPITKHEIDEIRGVESGHLLRALMERGLVNFNGKSDLPGKPMTYGSTRKFLEIFGLRNLKELPTLSEIDELIPEGIGEVEEKESLSDLTDRLSTEITATYSEGEDELLKINEQLQQIDTTSEFFEQEKQRERDRRDKERAQDIREKLVLGDEVDEKDRRWLDKYEARLQAIEAAAQSGTPVSVPAEDMEAAPEIGDQLQALTEEGVQAPTADQGTEGEESEESEDDLSDVDPSLFGEGESDDDLAGNVDWDEDQESGKDD